MSPPPRIHQAENQPQHQQQPSSPAQPNQMVPFIPASLPSTPIPLYPTGAAAIIPAPPTYELIPNRIFVGGFPTSTTETDLREHFEKFFPVKDVKMVKSLDGVSKGYGFITFDSEDQAEEIRQLNPKQLEFRNRKLNLGPAIRKLNSNGYPPGYAITTSSQLMSATPPPFGYAIPSPAPYSGFSIATPQMFVYPPVAGQDQNRPPVDQHTPQTSPVQQQVFFAGGDQEPVRTYANAVSGVEKSESSEEPQQAGPQPLGVNNNLMNTQHYQGHPQQQPQQQQWTGNGNEYDQNNNSHNGQMHYGGGENYFMPLTPYTPNGMNDKNGCGPIPMHVYMNSNGMYTPNVAYMSPPIQGAPYPMYPNPYWQQQHQQKAVYPNGYGYNNNWVGPNGGGDMHQQPYYPGNGYQGYQGQGVSDENYPRPLQAPRAGKKNRKPSESQEKKNKSPTKNVRNSDKSASSSPDSKNQQQQQKKSIPPLTASLQSLAISSPTKN